jgi:aldehyde dehydrogenase (NAD+)
MPSERPGHRLSESWHPLGVVGVISAFNFPVAVWAWNTAIALVCGDTVVWKPSEQAPLCAAACTALLRRACLDVGADHHVHQLIQGGAELGELLTDDPRVALLSATGSVRMGRAVGPRVAARFGRSLLELGGNNAAVVAPSADLQLTARAVVFAAAGTAGQRCTTLRRLIVHRSVADDLAGRIAAAYRSLRVGNPLHAGVLVGPLIDHRGLNAMTAALSQAAADGGKPLCGGERVDVYGPDSFYVRPALVSMPEQTAIVREETFAPLLWLLRYDTIDEAIELNNAVPQGL